MKKRLWFVLVLALLLCLMRSAGAEKRVIPEFWPSMEAGEICLPAYPDWGYLIGEGLTKEDFDITYLSRSSALTIGEDGTLTVSASASGRFYLSFDVIYTPKIEGVGEKTSFVCAVIDAGWLKIIKPNVERKIVSLDQPGTIMLETNSSGFPKLAVGGYDESIIDIELSYASSTVWHYRITPLALGETTVTVTGYNGISCTFDVVVLAPPTELTFAKEVYHGYVGEGIDLGLKLGEGEHAPLFEKFGVTKRFAMTDTGGGTYYTSGYFPDGRMGKFVAEEAGKYIVEAKTYNGFSDSAVVYVYKRADAVSVKMTSDVIRVGEEGYAVIATDENGKQFYPRHVRITKGNDIAFLEGPMLHTTGAGEVEVTVTNEDGSKVSCTFMVEVYPTEIIFNVDELTLEIGETFEIEVGFDQGWLEYQWWATEHNDPVPYNLYPVQFKNGVVTAQAPGKRTFKCTAGTLTKFITITVPDSDKTLSVHAPDNPVGVGDTFRIIVKDKTGKVYPGKYTLHDYETDGEVTAEGVFTALHATMSAEVFIKLEDGRHLTYKVVIVQKPLWLRHTGIIAAMGEEPSLKATSDVGDIPWRELEVKVADESIATYNENSGYFTLKKRGITKVTITSIYTGVSTEFTLEVRPQNDNYFVGESNFELPYGFSTKLPVVYDEKGNAKSVKWAITYDNPGTGNPNKSGFKLDGDVITCTWPTASCEVTGYVGGGSKWVRVTVFAYKMPDAIRIEPEIIELNPGESITVKVVHDEPGAKFPVVYWMAETAGIIDYQEIRESATNTFTAKAPGTTLVMAFLDNEAYGLCMVTVVDPNVRLPGDVDDNGAVSMDDAIALLQHASDGDVCINESNGDVNADGAVDIFDALLIMQYVAGWNVTLR